MTGEKIIRNEDNADIMPIRGRGFVIGYVDEVNGTGAEEVDSFTPTRHELIQLVKYWAKKQLDIHFFEFLTGQTGSTEIRLKYFARERIARVSDAIGRDEVYKKVDEVYEEFSRGVEDRLWQIFRKRDLIEWEAVRADFHADCGQEPGS